VRRNAVSPMKAARARAWRWAAATALLAVLATGTARAHLRTGESSLVEAFTAADAMVVARSLDATRATSGEVAMRTSFAPVEPLAGEAPVAPFALESDRWPVRFPAGETVVLLLVGGETAPGTRHPPAAAGVRLFLPPAGLSDSGRKALRQLWSATHGEAGASETIDRIDPLAVTAALAAVAASPEPRLHALAAVELATIADHPEYFSDDTRGALARLAGNPEADRPLVAALGVALRRLEAVRERTGGTPREKP
jgi:hypothetical protein